ncbi:hypothetical protein CEXT_544251 [Caerostris extrusa]|uniref:Uncharacterized protein n=1 Tax=Caerostris extrusa TaxID=172846 RepID=A0AAV4Q9X5_CAEEX|nr:hypothetical protein CEXT_544251 [Caerostris extrusa]
MTAEDVPTECSRAIKGVLSFIMARWDVLQSSFPHVIYSVHDDFCLQTKQPISQTLLLQTAETCPPTNAQRVKGSPIHLIASDRPVDTILKCVGNQDPRGQRRRRRKSRDNSIRAEAG